MTKNIPSCTNCRYYLQYYVKSLQGRLKKVGQGQCTHSQLTAAEKNKYIRTESSCAFWEEYEWQRQERQQNIRSRLERMAQNLKDIALMLQDDTQDDI